MFGWCGPACLSMALYAVGLPISQEILAEIAPYDPSWGTDYDAMLHASREFVPDTFSLRGNSLEELYALSDFGVVILNFNDSLPEDDAKGIIGDDGHYSLLEGLDADSIYITDPNPLNCGGGHRRLNRSWFESHFWDINRDGQTIHHWALFIPR